MTRRKPSKPPPVVAVEAMSEEDQVRHKIRLARDRRIAAERARVLRLTDPPKSADPAVAERERLKAEADRIAKADDTVVNRDAAGRLIGARRLDVFSLLFERKAMDEAHYLAVRRLEADIHLAAGVAGTSEAREFVQGGGGQERVTQRMVDAHGRVVVLTGMMGRDVSELLLVLLSPIQRGAVLTRWRREVERITGARSDDTQADKIRWAAATAAAAYASLDYGEPAQRRTA